jgi:hypothetical protein
VRTVYSSFRRHESRPLARSRCQDRSQDVLALPQAAACLTYDLTRRALLANPEHVMLEPNVTPLTRGAKGVFAHLVRFRSRLARTSDKTGSITRSGRARSRRRLSFPGTCAAVALLMAASTIACGGGRLEHAGRSDARLDIRASEEKGRSYTSTILLRAQTYQTQSGPHIELLWDASAQPVRRSSYGVLYIYDGGVPKKLLLQRRALDLGWVKYRPASEEVTFHFILEQGEPRGDWLLVLLGTPEATRAGFP